MKKYCYFVYVSGRISRCLLVGIDKMKKPHTNDTTMVQVEASPLDNIKKQNIDPEPVDTYTWVVDSKTGSATKHVSRIKILIIIAAISLVVFPTLVNTVIINMVSLFSPRWFYTSLH